MRPRGRKERGSGAARGGAQDRKTHSVPGKHRTGAKVLRPARAVHAGTATRGLEIRCLIVMLTPNGCSAISDDTGKSPWSRIGGRSTSRKLDYVAPADGSFHQDRAINSGFVILRLIDRPYQLRITPTRIRIHPHHLPPH